jgi:N-dimethylarginine dimethylaminohydrolase
MTDAGAPTWGARDMTSPLLEVLVHRPDAAFGTAFEDPAHAFRHPVDLVTAQAEHDAYTDLLGALGVRVRRLVTQTSDPDLVYTFDPVLMTDAGAILLRPGKANRKSEVRIIRNWLTNNETPIAGRIGPKGTIEGGDVCRLRPDLLCIGRSLRTNAAGAAQLADILGEIEADLEVRTFDLPYWRGPEELVHLLSVISPIARDLAVVYPPLLPIGLWDLLGELEIGVIAVPDDEYETLGCNVLVVRPGVVVVAEGNPTTRRALEAAGVEVHAYPATEIGLNGSGGPTCMALPIQRA